MGTGLVFSQLQVQVIHLSESHDNARLRGFFGALDVL